MPIGDVQNDEGSLGYNCEEPFNVVPDRGSRGPVFMLQCSHARIHPTVFSNTVVSLRNQLLEHVFSDNVDVFEEALDAY